MWNHYYGTMLGRKGHVREPHNQCRKYWRENGFESAALMRRKFPQLLTHRFYNHLRLVTAGMTAVTDGSISTMIQDTGWELIQRMTRIRRIDTYGIVVRSIRPIRFIRAKTNFLDPRYAA